jgi:hypothetical protein
MTFVSTTAFRLASATSAMAVAGLLTLSATPAGAARTHDADHDGMPNRWEARYHLGAHHANARADRDHDGLRNLAEYREGTDPTDEDTDGDGVEDGDDDDQGQNDDDQGQNGNDQGDDQNDDDQGQDA